MASLFRASAFCCLIAGVCLSVPLSAKEVMGVSFEDNVSLQADSPPLVLNGTAVRRQQQYTLYIAGLYLSAPEARPERVLSDSGPKRLELKLQAENLAPEAIIAAWERGFALNLSPEQRRELFPELEHFNHLWTMPLRRNDSVTLDYLPEQGTRVSVNGQLLGIIPGALFNRALLSIFIGRHPIARQVKDGLLGL